MIYASMSYVWPCKLIKINLKKAYYFSNEHFQLYRRYFILLQLCYFHYISTVILDSYFACKLTTSEWHLLSSILILLIFNELQNMLIKIV